MSSDGSLGHTYFLSYSRADEGIALPFARTLREAGIAMWVDQFDIRPSEHWDRAIERAVRECRGIVVMLSPRSAASDNVADEISFALEHGKSVLPVMIERCSLPLRITRMQVIDATGDYDRALRQSIAVLQGKSAVPGPIVERRQEPKGISDGAVLAAAKERLTHILGPIAGLLVDKEAARANSTGELYELLAQHIGSEKDRKRFLNSPGMNTREPSSSPIEQKKVLQESVPPDEIVRLTSLLTHYLGPIATVIARREGAGAASSDELQQRLASRIPDGRDRADFLRQAAAR
jgi:hypothetical protein